MTGEVLWAPSPQVLEHTEIGRYLNWLREERGRDFGSYQDLWKWSVGELDAFWQSIWDFFGIRSYAPHECVLRARTMPGAEWFPGALLNYAEHMLGTEADAGVVAVVAHSQTRATRELTFGDLREQVAQVRRALIGLGVGPRDRVVGYLPNIPETLVAFIATASLGAIWAACPPEFGARSVTDRFAQLDPKVLLAVGGYGYRDRYIDRRAEVAEIRASLPTLEHTISVPYGESEIPDTIAWNRILAGPPPAGPPPAGPPPAGQPPAGPPPAGQPPAGPPPAGPAQQEFEPVAFDHPLYVLFSSGTTGLPKAIVHCHGGQLIEHMKNQGLNWDLKPGARLQWFTTTAWMMWNALASALLLRSSIVMIDGDPAWPDLLGQWRLAEQTQPTVLGVSPSFLMACRNAGVQFGRQCRLDSIRMICTAGSPLPAEGYDYARAQLGPQVPLNNGSGGTDVCTGLVGGSFALPVYRGEIAGRCLGVDLHAFGPAGREVPTDELGEMVITSPMPSMPVGFWNDPDGRRLHDAYFAEFPGVWRQGDWIRFTERGSCVVTGRSDATLNRGGVRLGTGEFYPVVEELPEILDSLVVHLEDAGGGNGELLLFVVPTGGVELDDSLRGRIATRLRSELSPRHVPDTIVGVPSIPRTLTGKKLEAPVKRILQGAKPETVVSRDALADADAIDAFVAFATGRLTTRA